MPAYAIFTSYARLDADNSFKKFVKEVRELVQKKTGRRPVEQICFVDGEGIKIGEEWTKVLANGVATSEVVICLMSPNYLGSTWCGRELEVFLRRIASQVTAAAEPVIFPVWWELLPGRVLPPTLANYLNDEDAFPRRYREKGLRQLAKLPKFRGAFLEFVEILSERIRDTLTAPAKLPQYDDQVDFSSIPSAFENTSRAYDLELLALPVGGEAWKPAAGSPSLAETVAKVCGNMRIFGRFLAVPEPVATEATIQRAHDNRQVLLCVVDRKNVTAEPMLEALNGRAESNLAYLVVDTDAKGGTPAPIADWAGPFGAGNIQDAVRDGRAIVAKPGDFPAALERLICLTRNKLIELDTPARAENPALAAQARAEGVPTEQRPNLNGPGGGVTT